MFSKVLIANRGAIACRIIRTLRKMGIKSVAVYSDADAHSLHVLEADEAVLLGASPASESYLAVDKVLAAAKATGAQAIHPGYGFLSENVGFARACEAAGIRFIGPRPEHVEAFALKHTARALAEQSQVPILPGTSVIATLDAALLGAERLRYPVMLKSSGGGGGIGMRVCATAEALEQAWEPALRLSQSNFGDSGLYLEKYVARARHIEVQIFGDGRGEVIALGERDCSAQRRHQKVLEETPAPHLRPQTREAMLTAAVLLGKSVSYANAGTVEFIYDEDTSDFYFLEVNTRLQVEHGVTEQVTGIDLVEWMIEQAAGELPPLVAMPTCGWSIEARIYAEDPARNFQPTPGMLSHVRFPMELARIETWVESGSEVTPFYDPMIAKIIVTGVDRADAVSKMQAALATTELYGTETNLAYLRAVVSAPEFEQGRITTAYLGKFKYQRNAIEILESGPQMTVQDYPGRQGYWHVGVPPSGPMDPLAFRIANRLVGNSEEAAAIELTTIGGRIRFDTDTVIALTGANMEAKVDGKSVPCWRAIEIKAGSVLKLGAARGAGTRAYLAIRGGLDVAEYLGSRSTFMLGKFGGHAGRALVAGDVLHVCKWNGSRGTALELSQEQIPTYAKEWSIGVLFGPHTAPEFFTEPDIEMLFSTDWRVHYQSDRTGVRLLGPKPVWSRPDGGEAGLHPSNIHDNAYAVGAIDFTGDMPILLGPDGPSLGGFVCPAVVVQAELWKLGQLKAGDTVRFQRLALRDAEAMERAQEEFLRTLSGRLPELTDASSAEPAILRRISERANGSPSVTFRADGDKYLLVELGENHLDLALRLRVHLLETALRGADLPGIVDITPGVRSLHIHYDNRKLPREQLLEALVSIESALPDPANITVPSRIVYLPLSWDDPAARLAQAKYMQAVRPDAPWCPSNIEFIRRINGLSSTDDVYRTVFDASYLVLGLGDVYLGAPLATPLDPRHRLVTTKYNPARTWTPENAVGIGGAYLCIYGMEGPGGYQLVGRTIQVWNTYKTTEVFTPGHPWLLRFFDQIRFFPVSGEDLLEARAAFPHGKYEIRIEQAAFSMREYESFLDSIRAETETFRAVQKQAFNAERERWKLLKPLPVEEPEPEDTEAIWLVPEGCEAVIAPTTASVFQISVELGQHVFEGDKVVVLDAMKTELVVTAAATGIVETVLVKPGALVSAGQQLVILRVDSADLGER
jgi:urea carboxylase